MPRARNLIRTSKAAEMLNCSAKTIKRGSLGLKLYPMNPESTNPIWMVEEMEVKALMERRLRAGKEVTI